MLERWYGLVTMSDHLDKVKRKHTINPLDNPLIIQCINTQAKHNQGITSLALGSY